EPLGAALAAGGDVVQLILHGGGEVIVDQGGEIGLQQADHREGNPGRHQGITTGVDVPAVLDGLDDGGIRGRTPDAEVLHLLHQGGLGVAGRRIGAVAIGGDVGGGQ